MPRRVWKVVEVKAREIVVAKVKERRSKEGERGGKEVEKKKETNKGKDM